MFDVVVSRYTINCYCVFFNYCCWSFPIKYFIVFFIYRYFIVFSII